jgi:polygalacturonase
MAIGGAGLLAAMGQTDASAATGTPTATPDWFNVTGSAYGADNTRSADSTAAFNAAIAAAVKAGGGVVYVPNVVLINL